MYDGVVDEILNYSVRGKDGRWIIPISVDWDFTLTKNSDWESGYTELNEYGFEVLKRWQEKYNVGIILNSMRHKAILKEPLKILKAHNIEIYGIGRNPNQDKDGNKVYKCFSVFDIDDRNVGVPKIDGIQRPYVNWEEVEKIMEPILNQIYYKLKAAKL
jgi:L-rhamnose mutarotase